MVVGPSRAEFLENLGVGPTRADFFLFFFFFQKSGRLGPSRKKIFKKKKSRPESKKKLGPSRPDSGPVGPLTVKSFPKKKKTKKKQNKKKKPQKKKPKKIRLGPTRADFFLSRAEFFRLGPTRADPEKKIFQKKK